ncbi:hypothetical protein ES703_104949 [subsurface metagenome]
MRHSNPDTILKPNETETETGLETTGGDWISRINLTINNFKELIKLAQQFRGEEPKGEDSNPRPNPNSPTRTPGLADYIHLAISAGYGDTPIGELIEQISPHTLNKIMEIIKRAGPKQ